MGRILAKIGLGACLEEGNCAYKKESLLKCFWDKIVRVNSGSGTTIGIPPEQHSFEKPYLEVVK